MDKDIQIVRDFAIYFLKEGIKVGEGCHDPSQIMCKTCHGLSDNDCKECHGHKQRAETLDEAVERLLRRYYE